MHHAITVLAALAVCVALPRSGAAELVLIEPDDYPQGAIINHPHPGVTLSAEGSTPATPDVRVSVPGLGRTSTGVAAFGYDRGEPLGGSSSWRDDSVTQARLRATFDPPTDFVAIDVVTAYGTGEGVYPGVLIAYDADGHEIARGYTTGGAVDFQTATVQLPEADIAAVEAHGFTGPVKLDRLVFEGEPAGIDPLVACLDDLSACRSEEPPSCQDEDDQLRVALDSCEAALREAQERAEQCADTPEVEDPPPPGAENRRRRGIRVRGLGAREFLGD